MAGLFTKLVGVFRDDEDDDAEEVARRAAEEEQERAERERDREAQQSALRALIDNPESAGRMEMRGGETESGEGDRLGRYAGVGGRLGEPRDDQPPVDMGDRAPPDTYLGAQKPAADAPRFSMAVGEPTVTIPADEIQVTPSPEPGPDRATMDRIADLAIAQGSQQSMAAQGYGGPTVDLGSEPVEIQAQRSALGAMQQPAESGAASAAPPPPSGPAGVPASGSAAPSGDIGAPQSGMSSATAPPPQHGLPGTRLPAMQQATDIRQAQQPGGAQPRDRDASPQAPQPIDTSGLDDDVTRQRRVERTMNVLGALLRLGGAAGGVAATMRGNPIGALAGAGIAKGGGALAQAIGEGRGAQAERDRRVGVAQQQASRRDAMQALQAAMMHRDRERRARQQERRLDIDEGRAASLIEQRRRVAEQSGQLTEEKRAELEARTRRFDEMVTASAQDRRLEAEMREPTSRVSENARALYRAARAVLPELDLPDEQLERMSAAELRPLIGDHGAMSRRLSARIRRGGGGGSSQPSGPDPLRDVYRDVGGGDEARGKALFEAMSAGGRTAAIERAAGGDEIFPGVRSEVDLTPSEISRLRDGIAALGSYNGQLDSIADVQRRYGGIQAKIDPAARAEIVPHLTLLSGMVATLGQTGTINEGEVPRINAALPNPADIEQMTFGQFNRKLQTWKGLLDNSLTSALRARSINEQGIERVRNIMSRGISGSTRGGGQPSRRYRVSVPGREPQTMSEAGLARARAAAERAGIDLDVEAIR